MSLRTLRDAWNRFFFAPQGVEAVAIFRVAVGALLVLWSLLLIPEFWAWFGSEGVLGWSGVHDLSKVVSLWLILGRSDAAAIVIWALGLISGFGMILGFRTRLSTVVAWLAMTSLAWRNPYIYNSGDTLLRIFVFYLIFTPAGWAFSLDERRRRASGKPSPVMAAPWAMRLIQLQVSWVYLVSFWSKLFGAEWLDGTAVYYVLRIGAFQKFPVPEFLAQSMLFSQVTTWGTLFAEFAIGALIWIKELRPYVILVGVGLHLSIEYSMNIPIFELIAIAGFVVFVDSTTWRRWAQALRARTGSLGARVTAVGRSS